MYYGKNTISSKIDRCVNKKFCLRGKLTLRSYSFRSILYGLKRDGVTPQMSHFPKPEAFRADAPTPASTVRRNPGSVAEMLAMLAEMNAKNGPKTDAQIAADWPEDGPDDDEKLADIDPAYWSEDRILERVEATVERRGLHRI